MINNSEKIDINRIIELARWAPSGDNTQPWRFEICSDSHLVVHGFDTRRNCVYDLEGHASQIAIGALLEYLSIAASEQGLKAEISYRTPSEEPDETPSFDIFFHKNSNNNIDRLVPFLKTRCVNRRPFGSKPISENEKNDLKNFIQSKYPLYQIHWIEGLNNKLSMANITQRSGKLRLTLPEAYLVHKEVIEWGAKFSEDKIPDHALGLSPFILPLMCWIMKSWNRVRFFNKFLGGTLIPRLQLDILPSILCSAHFLLLAPYPPKSLLNYVEAGKVLARFWLGTASLRFQFQPEMTPLIFQSYMKENILFSSSFGAMTEASKISSSIEKLVGKNVADKAVFLGRIGRGECPEARSLRLSLSSLKFLPILLLMIVIT